MPKHVITDAQVTLNGAVLSTRVKKVTILVKERAPAMATAMTDDWEDRVKVGIRDWKINFEFYQDYSTSTGSNVFATLKAIFESTAGSGVAVLVKPTTEIQSATNPTFSGNVLTDGSEITYMKADDVGDLNMTPLTMVGAGALSVLTSSS
jgi:hypothetical protein